MFILAFVAILFVAVLFTLREFLVQSQPGPWRCSCGVVFNDPDAALHHASVAKHTFD